MQCITPHQYLLRHYKHYRLRSRLCWTNCLRTYSPASKLHLHLSCHEIRFISYCFVILVYVCIMLYL